MFDYLEMAYKDSDCATVIAVMCWPKCIILVLKTLLSRVLSAFLFRLVTIARVLTSTFIGSTDLRKAHEDSKYTAMITVVDWHLHSEAHSGGKVVSAVTISCLPSGRHAQIAWLSRGMCINWNEPLASHLLCTDAFEWPWVHTGECKQSLPRYPQGQSKIAIRSGVATH